MNLQKNYNCLPKTEQIIQSDKGFIEYNEENFFYKRCKEDLSYRELIAYEIATFLKIPSISYKIVLIPNKHDKYDLGVISKDYKKTNYIYIKGKEVILDYNKDYLKQWFKEYKKNNFEFNNLENIWHALEYRYRFLKNKKAIIEKIIKDIIKNIFLFDIFTQNDDRHYNNWEIAENTESDEIYLNPIYDNEDIFYRDFNKPNLGCTIKNKNEGDWYEIFKEFLGLSRNEYLSIISNYYNQLTVENLILLIKLTETKHQIEIPPTTKKDIISKYIKHYDILGNIIKEFTKEEKRYTLTK